MLTEMPGRELADIDVLVVGPVPDFDRASGSLRFYLMLQMLARRYRITLLGWIDAGDPQSQRYVRALEEAGVAVQVVSQAGLIDGMGRIHGTSLVNVSFSTLANSIASVG